MNTHVSTKALAAASDLPTPITVAYGDGVGPEIMSACLRILEAGGARLAAEPVEIGLRQYERGRASGVGPDLWPSLARTGVFYKAPLTTPQGGGMKSVNVTLRKTLGLFANVRPCVAYAPAIRAAHPGMDVVIVRENEEDLYAGIEHRQTDDVVQCLKLVSRQGCERIVRYAFEYAAANGRRKVTCMTKDNIMKMTDGLFRRTFEEVAQDYPFIETEHLIIDIGAARLATNPDAFDVVVTMNLYGDILSDIAAEAAGSVGLAGSANVGESCAMFEAIHGSAPTLAGRDAANPSGLLLAGVMMLTHIGQSRAAERVHNAWLRTLEDGIHTFDIHTPDRSQALVGTRAFADAVIERIGRAPRVLTPARYDGAGAVSLKPASPRRPQSRALVGVDVFVRHDGATAELVQALLASAGSLRLEMISNRGVKVWPEGHEATLLTDHWRCRFTSAEGAAISAASVAALLLRFATSGVDVVKTENLYTFDGAPGYSAAQGA
ncbi:MAG TPA: NADP-dependent isocitrate dehydrogenase [Beijerinckiaceae bacterium]|jgi:isocitrate dehydrogenase